MSEIVKIEFQKELQIHSSVITVIQTQLNGLLSCHEDLNQCIQQIQAYSAKFLDMKKVAKKLIFEDRNLGNLNQSQEDSTAKEVKGDSFSVKNTPQKSTSQQDEQGKLYHQQKSVNQSSTKFENQTKVCIDFLSFTHKNILAPILASLISIEKHRGSKDFKDKLEGDVCTIGVQCSKLEILIDYIDKWISIDTDKDCIINPSLLKVVMSAVKIEDISQNLGSDIEEQYSQFLNVIYSTYALIYEHGQKKNSQRQDISSQQNGNNQQNRIQLIEGNNINHQNSENQEQQQKQEQLIQSQNDQVDQNHINNQNSNKEIENDRKKQQLGSFEVMFKSMKFLIYKEQAKRMTEKLQLNPTPEQIILAWRMYEIVPEVKAMFSLQLERVNFSEKFYIPRFTKRIDLRYILQNAQKYFSFPQNLSENESKVIKEKISECLSQTKFMPSYNHLFFQQKPLSNQTQLSTTDFISSILYNRNSFSYNSNVTSGRSSFQPQTSSFLFGPQYRVSPQNLLNIKEKDHQLKIKVRIISSYKLENAFDIKDEENNTIFDKLSNIMCISRNKTHQFNGIYNQMGQNGHINGNGTLYDETDSTPRKKVNIILHIHGGGFVSMNSFSHQIYTRKWANQIEDSVIISVDYRKAPENRYPAALDDIWQVYNFIIYHLEDVFPNITINSIILAGDSAGGNLCLSLMNLIIQEELFRRPVGILLSYPALDLNSSTYTPSKLHSLQDVVLPSSFLKICLGSYLPNSPEYLNDIFVHYDSLLSPILIPDNILQQFPPVHIFCGQEDPLYDDTIRFFHRIRLLKDPLYIQIVEQYEEKKIESENGDSQKLMPIKLQRFESDSFIESQKEILQNQSHISLMTVYPRLKHGYLNLDFPFGMPIVRKCVNQTIESLKKLIQQSQNNNQALTSQRSSTIRSQLIRNSHYKTNNNSSPSDKNKLFQTCPDLFTS